MPVTTADEEPEEGDDEPELTHEQREKLRRLAEHVRGIAVPKIDVKLPDLGTSAFAKIAADLGKIPSLTLPESTLRNITALSGIAGQQSKLLDSFKPLFAMQESGKKQFSAINSDFFKVHAANQAQFAKLGAQLTRNIDFGLSESVAKVARQFAAQQSSWLKTIGPILERLRESFYPENLRGIEDLEFEDVEKVVMADSVALYGVPRTSIAKALIRAESAAKRREILGRTWKAISADCRAALEGFESQTVAPYVPFGIAALDALDSGHTEAAQALTGSLIDSLLTAYFGNERYRYTPDKRGKRTTAAYDEFTVREFVAFAPMWQTYQQFWAENGDKVPTTFSRNATAHTVSPRQFNRRNAVQGLLFATSLMFFRDEQATKRRAA